MTYLLTLTIGRMADVSSSDFKIAGAGDYTRDDKLYVSTIS